MIAAINIATSGLIAQKTRVNVASTNLANQFTTMGPNGEYAPFQRRMAIFKPGDLENDSGRGVHVAEIMHSDSYKIVHDPTNQFADEQGNVRMPDINPAVELANAMEAVRSYEANVSVIEASKAMSNSLGRILA